MNLKKYFRTPKGLVILTISALAIVAMTGERVSQVLPLMGAAVGAAMIVDAPILRWRQGEWVFPDGALLTGMFIALILSPLERWPVAALSAVVAVISKYVFRLRNANVFNPAALALVISFFAFNSGQSWWGALPELHPAAIVLLFAAGIFITQRVNKVPAVLAFLGVYYLLITTTAFVGDPARMAQLYRAPDLHAALFYAFFMVTDPPTSPPKNRDQWIFGAIAGATAYGFFVVVHSVYFLLAGLLVANVWEGWRKWSRRRRSPG